MSRIHEYFTLERWVDYFEQRGSENEFGNYSIPDYRFIRMISEAQIMYEQLQTKDDEIEAYRKTLLNIGDEYKNQKDLIKELIEGLEFYGDFINRDNSDGNGGMYYISYQARTILNSEAVKRFKNTEVEGD